MLQNTGASFGLIRFSWNSLSLRVAVLDICFEKKTKEAVTI
jgi:hypothetical protein